MSEDRAHDLRIMRPTRCQLRYSRLSVIFSHGLKTFRAGARALPSLGSPVVKYWSLQIREAAGSMNAIVFSHVAKLHLARIELATFSV